MTPIEVAKMDTPRTDAQIGKLVIEAGNYRRMYQEAIDNWNAMADLARTLEREAASLRAERDRLRLFVARLFDLTGWPDGGDLDGFDFQDAATEHGILTPETRTEPCNQNERDAKHCHCEEYGDFPQTCYRKAEWLIALADKEPT